MQNDNDTVSRDVRGLPRGEESNVFVVSNQFPSSVIRAPSPSACCTCEHWVHCACGCHGRHCDPAENTCDVAFVPDEGGLTRWGCPTCTPGEGAPHYLGCDLIGWSVPIVRQRG